MDSENTTTEARSFLIEPNNAEQTAENVQRIVSLLREIEVTENLDDYARMGMFELLNEVFDAVGYLGTMARHPASIEDGVPKPGSRAWMIQDLAQGISEARRGSRVGPRSAQD